MKMKFLFLFMDGVGLGADNPDTNPLSKAKMPNLSSLLGGGNLVNGAVSESERASLTALDAVMGIEGIPQSATGQAALVTGKNVPEIIGKHYGPKPNKPVADVMREGTLFSTLTKRGYRVALLNSYPQPYFDGIESGRRIYSAIPLAMTNAGVKLKTVEDLHNGSAITADFTGEGWRSYFKDDNTPLMSPHEAGKHLGKLASQYDFAFFEYWPSDYAGHKQDEESAIKLLESFDGVLGGLLEAWDDEAGLILITSDHGNMEDLSTRRHTSNPVPALVIGAQYLRKRFIAELKTIADVTPAILQFYENPE
jgi:hypothetical protein